MMALESKRCWLFPSHALYFFPAMIAKVAIAVVGGFLGWIYTRIKPPPLRVCGSPGGPPITSPRIQLNDGRHLPYREWGVSKDKANYKIIVISYCPPTETDLSSGKKLVVVVYNSRGWKRSDVIRLSMSCEREYCCP
ncbi:hypothetical protein Lser_V15G07263 [Lactuca serriola]